MQVNNLTLAFLLEEIRPILLNGFVNKIQQIQNGVFKIKVHTKEGSKDLIATETGLFITNYSFPAKLNPNTFFSILKKTLSNKKIISITQHEFDRVVQIEFSDYYLILEFFHNSNAILCDKELKIVAVFKREEWKDRSLKRSETYKFPFSNGKNPVTITEEFLSSAFLNSTGTVIQVLITEVNIAPLVAEEVFFQLKINKNTPAKSISKTETKKISQKTREIYAVKKSLLKPVLFNGELLPFAFSSLKEQFSVTSLCSAMDDFYSKELVQKPIEKEQKEKQTQINRLEFSLAGQKKHQKLLEEKSGEFKKAGDLIYEHFNELQEILGAVNAAKEKELKEKEVMYKINFVLSKKQGSKLKVSELNFSKKELVIEIQ